MNQEPTPAASAPLVVLSLRQYAKRIGVSVEAVSKAVSKERLRLSVTRDSAGKPKIADAELADREWAANTDLSRAPGYVKDRAAAAAAGADGDVVAIGDQAPSLANSSALEKHWRAKQAELDYKRDAGELVDAAEMTARIADAFSLVRTKLLGLPAKAKQQMPHLSHGDVAALDALVREALDALAESELEP